MRIREATPADQPAWLSLRCDLWPGSDAEHTTAICRFFAGVSSEPLAVLLAEDERHRIVGFVELSIRPYAEGGQSDRVAFVEGLFVVADCRRRGVGRALIAASEHWALAQGCTELGSDTEVDNLPGVAAHLANGFVEVGSTRNFLKVLTERAHPGVRNVPGTTDLKLYSELSSWWPLISPPSEYVEEAAFYRNALQNASRKPIRTLLELGSGGGSNAFHLKPHYKEMVLVDVSPAMLDVSRALNPTLEHLAGDMRTARLGRQFDAVFIHDAICYMTTEHDLRQTIETAFVHCRPGGVALLAPDYIRENFHPSTDHGGHDDGRRGMRFVEWSWDPDPADTTYLVDYAYLLREADGSVRVEHDRHLEGLFPRETWLRLLRDIGFEPHIVPLELTEVETQTLEVFVCTKPESEI